MVQRSPGLRLAIVGAVIFVLSVLALIVLPNGPPVAGMLVGGLCVWVGFIWTIFSYYRPT